VRNIIERCGTSSTQVQFLSSCTKCLSFSLQSDGAIGSIGNKKERRHRYGITLKRFALRAANAITESRLHGGGGCFTLNGHRCEHGALQSGGCDVAEDAAGQRAGATCALALVLRAEASGAHSRW